ncbi:MAG: branched-chain amino acid transaminase [Nanobdellota archaeon]
MEKTKYIWFNGKIIPWEDAKIHVLCHGLHYGSGAFEGIRVYNTEKGPAIFKLKEHIDRLFRSAEALKMNIPYTKDEISDAIKYTIKSNSQKDCYVRPIIFYGSGKMGLNPEGAELNVVIAVWPWPAYIGETANVCTSKYIRIHPESLQADKKICGHYVNSIMASQEAKTKGFDEALLLDWEGNIAEGPGENFFMVKDGIIITPPVNKNILPGITRNSVIKIARDLGYQVIERKISPKETEKADELFFTGTAATVVSIIKLDEKTYGEGKITHEIRAKYIDIIHGKVQEYDYWLDYVN